MVVILFPILLIIVAGLVRTWQVEHSLNQKLFSAGSLPKNLDGFYYGKVARLETSWVGKEFNASSSSGINRFQDNSKKYPFKTYAKGDSLILDYNVPENPFYIRFIVDELVQTGRDQFLGKLHINLLGISTSLGLFSLEKAEKSALPTPDYQIVLLGDSMTESLGNSEIMQSILEKDYPGKVFLILNYGYGSTSVIQAMERLTKETSHGRVFKPIMDIDFDLILIESFGHNPLSQFPLDEGLQKQNQALDDMVKTITSKKPKSSIVFVATIAPNKQKYALNSVDLSLEKRAEWAEERMAYIQNHIKYAEDHGIPIIDVYSKSLTNGDGNLKFIRNDDYIHPSPEGLYLISSEIATRISTDQLLP